MKILIIVDKEGTAIDRLAKSVQRNLTQHNIVVFPVHPKRNDVAVIDQARKLMEWADTIDIHYWKSGQVLRTTFPQQFMARPRILFHFNPYNVINEENQYYDKIVVPNSTMQTKVPSAYWIPLATDLSFFKYNQNYTEDKTVMMSVNRIEGKKGVGEVAQACKTLGYKFLLIGRPSKPDYVRQVLEVNPSIEFLQNVTDQVLLESYYRSAIHVCNSVDDFESGTLPIIESMACGIPVLTRNVGHVPDLYDGGNMVIRNGLPEDIEDLKKNLKEMMENREWRIKMREKGWETAKNMDDRRRALKINTLYYQIWQPSVPLVSIIMPTKDHPEAFAESLVGALQQDFKKYEIVVADSGEVSVGAIVKEARKETDIPIKYIRFKKEGYTLAEARNRAIIEADGEIIVFCDDRMKMLPDAVTRFATYSRPKTWLWGRKDEVTKSFVENFSCARRNDLLSLGMFCERMEWYGGMSQEVRQRFEGQNGIEFISIPEAQAKSVKRSTSKNRRREDIIEAKFLIFKMYGKT